MVGLLVSWAAPVVALHLVSGADLSFSTCNHSSGAETVASGTLTGTPLFGARAERERGDRVSGRLRAAGIDPQEYAESTGSY
jgi:hypothetical protein